MTQVDNSTHYSLQIEHWHAIFIKLLQANLCLQWTLDKVEVFLKVSDTLSRCKVEDLRRLGGTLNQDVERPSLVIVAWHLIDCLIKDHSLSAPWLPWNVQLVQLLLNVLPSHYGASLLLFWRAATLLRSCNHLCEWLAFGDDLILPYHWIHSLSLCDWSTLFVF